MRTGNFVSTAGSRFMAKPCGPCAATADVAHNGRWYCRACAPTPPRAVTAEDVRLARVMMLRPGWSLTSIASDLNVSRTGLDEALWRRIDQPRRLGPSGDFA